MLQPFKNKGFRAVGIDVGGWLVCDYRGATVRSKGTQHTLDLPGHPCDGMSLGKARRWMHIIDAWVDDGSLPPRIFGPLRKP
jgi:hypothetical protein